MYSVNEYLHFIIKLPTTKYVDKKDLKNSHSENQLLRNIDRMQSKCDLPLIIKRRQ